MAGYFKSRQFNEPGVDVEVFRPQMTSLIDILTLLLVFLIQSFNAEGNLITPSSDLQLPTSKSAVEPRPALTLEITNKSLLAQGELITHISSFANAAELLIDPLQRYLAAQKRLTSENTKKRELVIMCDRDMQFNVVKRVMYTCSKSGFSDFSVLAIQE
ncbi:MAG: biopolymer transporter ExbD [Chitinivibrionales bacterium]|nr:biopolymer transporter ExbD [Chitinivibrionales bacterium]